MSAYKSRLALCCFAIAGSMLLTGCANYIFNKFDLDGDNQSLSLDAKQRVVLVTERGGKTRDRKIVCAEPSPDAISASAASAAGSGALSFPTLLPAAAAADQKQGTTSGGGGFSGGSSESVASIAMRSQTIQLLRDGLYRACEAYMNGAIDQHQYNIITLNINKTMITLLAVDGIAGTHVTPPAQISANAPAVSAKASLTGGPGADANVAPAGPVTITNTYANTATAAGAVQSEAIANIVLDVNNHSSTPGLCISLLASGELRLDNPGQNSVLKSCDYLLNGAVRRAVNAPPQRAPTYQVSRNASNAQQGACKKADGTPC